MAYQSRSSRGGSRGGRSAPGGGGSPAALIIAIVLVLGGIAAAVVLTSKKDGPPPAKPSTPSTGPIEGSPTKTAQPPPPPPYPALDPKKIEEVRAKVKEFEPLIKKGQTLYDEALALKNAGKDAEWQDKLREAAEPFEHVKDAWNEIIDDMPSSPHYDGEDVANHYLGQEGTKVTKALSTLQGIKKQMRLR